MDTAASNPYMGAPVEVVTAPNGAIGNRRIIENADKVAYLERTVESPVPGVFVFGGFGLAPTAVIEAEDGLIAFDTGDVKHDGELILQALREFTDKPVKAIIYGHSHTVAGAGVLAEGNDDIVVIGHPDLNDVVVKNLGAGGAPAYFPEVSPYLTARAVTQFNGYMPSEGPDGYLLPTNLTQVDVAFIPVNTPVHDGQKMNVLGIDMQFFTKYGSDDKVHTTVWLPDRKIVFTTMIWNAPPQLYTLRGDVFRDPREWIAGLRFTMDLEPDVLVSAARRPIVGRENIQQALQLYMDGARFVLDQSLRGILKGLGPDDLRHFVKFPRYLDESLVNLQSYGEISSYPPAIFYQSVGWYDNDAANLKPIPPVEEARRWIELLGGEEAMLEAARKALDEREFAWAAKLANQAYLVDDQSPEARRLKAEALRQMAYVATGANDRAHLMSQALELEGKTRIARLIPPQPEMIVADPARYVEYFRIRIDPAKSDKVSSFVRFDFADSGSVGLDVRRAVAEFVPDPDEYTRTPDIILRMSGDTWADLYLSRAAPESLIETGAIEVTGDASEAARILNLFDRLEP
ncbi:MAG TPA: alkyl sulfatase dimerization domain-containing protein [Acidimicrobiia bacterium]|jgi:alkyl sulfatase BDS1-like metallo-beta-lactamase superfamily hydrolase|nr:alkyl sulfatase dimerization domain-containing protein [Acidimicrobiia bacterium]